MRTPPKNRVTAAELVQDLPLLCTVKEVAATLRVSERDIRRKIAAGRLDSVKYVPGPGSSRVHIPRSSVENVLAHALGESATC